MRRDRLPAPLRRGNAATQRGACAGASRPVELGASSCPHDSNMCTTERVGTNKRYADALQRRRVNREAEQRALVPRSLTEAERGIPVRSGPPVQVLAWVTYGDQSVRVLASVVEYTEAAVHIMWTGVAEEPRDCWIWASAAERVEP